MESITCQGVSSKVQILSFTGCQDPPLNPARSHRLGIAVYSKHRFFPDISVSETLESSLGNAQSALG